VAQGFTIYHNPRARPRGKRGPLVLVDLLRTIRHRTEKRGPSTSRTPPSRGAAGQDDKRKRGHRGTSATAVRQAENRSTQRREPSPTQRRRTADAMGAEQPILIEDASSSSPKGHPGLGARPLENAVREICEGEAGPSPMHEQYKPK